MIFLKTGPPGANGGPKWRQIWTFLKLLKKIAFYSNRIFLSRLISWYKSFLCKDAKRLQLHETQPAYNEPVSYYLLSQESHTFRNHQTIPIITRIKDRH